MPKSSTRKKKKSPNQAGGKKNAGKSAAAGGAENVAASQTIEGAAEEVRPKKKTSPLEFFQQVRSEGQKVTWTSVSETNVSTVMVLIMVIIMAIFFFIVDWVLRTGVCTVLPGNCAAVVGG